MRLVVETETARLAALNHSDEQVERFEAIYAQESTAPRENGALVNLDFSFHLLVAIASGNLAYPLIINSFKSVYTHLTGLFFHQYIETAVMGEVFDYHRRLIDAITCTAAGTIGGSDERNAPARSEIPPPDPSSFSKRS